MEAINLMVPMATVLNGYAQVPAVAVTVTAFALVLGAVNLIRSIINA